MKARVTVSLPAPLVKEAQRAAKRLGMSSRSAMFQKALELLLAKEREREIDAQLDAYYAGMSPAERDEEQRLVETAMRRLRRRDLDEEG